MFLSLRTENNTSPYKVEITDTDYIETISTITIWRAGVTIYERRNLNVPVNMARLILYRIQTDVNLVGDKMLDHIQCLDLCDQWVPDFNTKYRADTQKHLEKLMLLL
jgi:hypothetical protein